MNWGKVQENGQENHIKKSTHWIQRFLPGISHRCLGSAVEVSHASAWLLWQCGHLLLQAFLPAKVPTTTLLNQSALSLMHFMILAGKF